MSESSTLVREALLRHVADGSIRITELTISVARQTRTDIEKVTATVWELIDDALLDYRANALIVPTSRDDAQDPAMT